MSMSMLLNGLGYMIGGIALGIFGLGVCAVAYPLFKKINKKNNSEIQTLIESELDKLADICEQAAKLK